MDKVEVCMSHYCYCNGGEQFPWCKEDSCCTGSQYHLLALVNLQLKVSFFVCISSCLLERGGGGVGVIHFSGLGVDAGSGAKMNVENGKQSNQIFSLYSGMTEVFDHVRAR